MIICHHSLRYSLIKLPKRNQRFRVVDATIGSSDHLAARAHDVYTLDVLNDF